MSKIEKQLRLGLDALKIECDNEQVQDCLLVLEQLLFWNKKINLTAITKPSEVVTKHLLDSLAMLPILLETKNRVEVSQFRVLDVGTGAGFPALPLAIFTNDIRYFPLDSNSKKLAFIRRVANQLKLTNIQTVHSRIEDHQPSEPYQLITARAFADLNNLMDWLPKECISKDAYLLAMKGKYPEDELAQYFGSKREQLWKLIDSVPIRVPGLEAERCLLRFKAIA